MADALGFRLWAHLTAWERAEPGDASRPLTVVVGEPGDDHLRRPGTNLGWGVVHVMNDPRFTSMGEAVLILGRDEGV